MTLPIPGPVVSSRWLADHLSHPSLRVLDATWFLPNDPRNAEAMFREEHLPGAVRADIDALSDRSSALPHMAPDPQTFEALASVLGVGSNDTVVVYDAAGMFSAARVWWLFRLMGHTHVAVLDGGLPAWKRAGLPLASGDAVPRPASGPYSAQFQPRFVADLDAVRVRLSNRGAVLDARPADRFSGRTPEPRAGLRSGAMPGAVNIPFGSVLTADGLFRPESELRALFSPFAEPPICTCGSGVTAAILAVALARIGRDAAVYDGSWAEWGSRADTPVVQSHE